MSNSSKKPVPLYQGVTRLPCPICGHPSYSREGIHPQCAMAVADKAHIDRINSHPIITAISVETPLERHQKRCPECRAVLHVRRSRCHCGHLFGVAKVAVDS
jgi:hypothetical protein